MCPVCIHIHTYTRNHYSGHCQGFRCLQYKVRRGHPITIDDASCFDASWLSIKPLISRSTHSSKLLAVFPESHCNHCELSTSSVTSRGTGNTHLPTLCAGKAPDEKLKINELGPYHALVTTQKICPSYLPPPISSLFTRHSEICRKFFRELIYTVSCSNRKLLYCSTVTRVWWANK